MDIEHSKDFLEHTEPGSTELKKKLWRIIFKSDTKAGHMFDVILLVVVVLCVLTIVLESVDSLSSQYHGVFYALEWFFTGIFTVEYLLRLWVVRRRIQYAWSFYGIVDLVAIIPSYLELFLPGSHYLVTIRVLRLLRMFRILKMAEHLMQASVLMSAIKSSRHKIAVFLFALATFVLIEGTIVYVLEKDVNPGFSNIPQAIYWAVVTITTVGYGDVSPITVPGKMMASVIMLTGFAMIAVPTGVFTAELGREMQQVKKGNRLCQDCGWAAHAGDAKFCHQCASPLGMG